MSNQVAHLFTKWFLLLLDDSIEFGPLLYPLFGFEFQFVKIRNNVSFGRVNGKRFLFQNLWWSSPLLDFEFFFFAHLKKNLSAVWESYIHEKIPTITLSLIPLEKLTLTPVSLKACFGESWGTALKWAWAIRCKKFMKIAFKALVTAANAESFGSMIPDVFVFVLKLNVRVNRKLIFS